MSAPQSRLQAPPPAALNEVQRNTGMRLLRWQSWCAMAALVMTLVFVIFPGPYPMAIFTFIAQPLFAVAGISYIVEVIRDLHRKQIL